MADGDTFTVVEHDMVPAGPDTTSIESKRKEVLKWLQPTDYASLGNEYMKHLHARVPGTGRWVQESPAFRRWRGQDDVDPDDDGTDTESGYHRLHSPSNINNKSNASHCLHIKGVAGSGKSVFAASTIDQLQRTGAVVLFFFFRQIVDKNHSAAYLVRDFAAQLLPHCPGLVTELREISKTSSVRDAAAETLWGAICKAISREKDVFCVVDALDEMDDDDFQDTTAKLVALASDRARIMLTSRPLPKIENALIGKGVTQLKLDPVLLSPDVARYVDTRMDGIEPPLGDLTRVRVREAICKRASGLFLHARLVTDNLVESLKDGSVTEEELPAKLDQLPRSLRDVYEEMLKEHARRSGVSAEQQAKVLTCVTHSSRPLRLIELGSLLAQMLGCGLKQGKDLVRASCGRLLELLQDETVSVIHHSFTEFLHDAERKGDGNESAFPVLDDAATHDMLAALCLEYLDSCPHFDARADEGEKRLNYKDRDDRMGERSRRSRIMRELPLSHPLVSYAFENLAVHMIEAERQNQTARTRAAFDAYFQPGRPGLENWVLRHWDHKLTDLLNPLIVAGQTKRDERMPAFIFEHLVSKDPSLVDSRDSRGSTPLLTAASHSRNDLVSFFLSKGADPLLGDDDGCTALHCAVNSNSADVVRTLLNFGVDPLIKLLPYPEPEDWDSDSESSCFDVEREKTRRGRTALDFAVGSSNPEILPQFLPFIPDEALQACFGKAKTAENVGLILSLGKGRIDIDKAFLDRDSYRIYSAKAESKLITAAADHELELMKVLIEHGADVHQTAGYGKTALTALLGHRGGGWGSWEQDKAELCIGLLVQAGADVNQTIEDPHAQGFTPLHVAAHSLALSSRDTWGSTDMVTIPILLKHGADVHAATPERGNTALHLANLASTSVVQALLESGADINRINNKGETPLHLMLQHLGKTPPSRNSKVKKTLMMMLDRGADPTAITGCGQNLFHALLLHADIFCDPCFFDFFQRLLDAGVDLNLPDNNNKNEAPIFLYMGRGRFGGGNYVRQDDSPQMLARLVEGGLQLNVSNNIEPFLHHMLRNRNRVGRYSSRSSDEPLLGPGKLGLFINLGADANILDQQGKTLLHKAIELQVELKEFEYLLSLGIDVNKQDQNGDTALLTALCAKESLYQGDKSDMLLQLFLSHGADLTLKRADGRSLLHMVHPRMVSALLAKSVIGEMPVSDQDSDGRTPLHLVLSNWPVEHAMTSNEMQDAMAALLERGANITIASNNGMLPLHCAAGNGISAAVDFLLHQAKKQGLLAAHLSCAAERGSPLHYACRSGDSDAVAVLLWNGADPNLVNESGLAPLHALADCSKTKQFSRWEPGTSMNPEIVRLLHKHGANTNQRVAEASRSSPERIGATALDLAVKAERWETVRGLMECGAQVPEYYRQSADFITATDKEVALDAAKKIQKDVYAKMEAAFAETGRESHANDYGSRWSASKTTPEAVRGWVLGGESIANPLRRPDEKDLGKRVLNTQGLLKGALFEHDLDSIKEYMQQHGDDAGLKTRKQKDSFLAMLITHSYGTLLKEFANISEQPTSTDTRQDDFAGSNTLLGQACSRAEPSLHIIDVLVNDLGVDVNRRHRWEWEESEPPNDTPLHILAAGNYFWNLEAIEYLIAKGANVEALNFDGLTPALEAANSDTQERGKWAAEALRILLKHGADVNAKTAGKEEVEDPDYDEPGLAAGLSALHLAKNADIFSALTDYGIDISASPGELERAGRTYMIPGTVEALLDGGFDANFVPNRIDEHRKDYQRRHYNFQGRRSLGVSRRYALHEASLVEIKHHMQADFEARQEAVLKMLLGKGAANPYAAYPDGSFVLSRIIEDRGRADVCLSLVQEDLDVDRRGAQQRTMLISACIPSAPPAYNDWDHGDAQKPLAMSSAVLQLLALGANAKLVDVDQGRTALHWFCTQRMPFDEACQAAFKALVAKEPSMVSVTDNQGRAPLHLALEAYSSGKIADGFAIRHLLSAGGDLGTVDPVTGNSALHWVSMSLIGDKATHEAKTALFRELAASLDINALNNRLETPLAIVMGAALPARMGREPGYELMHGKTLDMMLKAGADVQHVAKGGKNLLHFVAGRPVAPDESWLQNDARAANFKRLMELGVDPRQEDDDLKTPIDIAVARNFGNIVDLFKEADKDDDIHDDGDDEGEAAAVAAAFGDSEDSWSSDGV